MAPPTIPDVKPLISMNVKECQARMLQHITDPNSSVQVMLQTRVFEEAATGDKKRQESLLSALYFVFWEVVMCPLQNLDPKQLQLHRQVCQELYRQLDLRSSFLEPGNAIRSCIKEINIICHRITVTSERALRERSEGLVRPGPSKLHKRVGETLRNALAQDNARKETLWRRIKALLHISRFQEVKQVTFSTYVGTLQTLAGLLCGDSQVPDLPDWSPKMRTSLGLSSPVELHMTVATLLFTLATIWGMLSQEAHFKYYAVQKDKSFTIQGVGSRWAGWALESVKSLLYPESDADDHLAWSHVTGQHQGQRGSWYPVEIDDVRSLHTVLSASMRALYVGITRIHTHVRLESLHKGTLQALQVMLMRGNAGPPPPNTTILLGAVSGASVGSFFAYLDGDVLGAKTGLELQQRADALYTINAHTSNQRILLFRYLREMAKSIYAGDGLSLQQSEDLEHLLQRIRQQQQQQQPQSSASPAASSSYSNNTHNSRPLSISSALLTHGAELLIAAIRTFVSALAVLNGEVGSGRELVQMVMLRDQAHSSGPGLEPHEALDENHALQRLLEVNAYWLVEPIMYLLAVFDDARLRQRLRPMTAVQLLLMQAQFTLHMVALNNQEGPLPPETSAPSFLHFMSMLVGGATAGYFAPIRQLLNAVGITAPQHLYTHRTEMQSTPDSLTSQDPSTHASVKSGGPRILAHYLPSIPQIRHTLLTIIGRLLPREMESAFIQDLQQSHGAELFESALLCLLPPCPPLSSQACRTEPKGAVPAVTTSTVLQEAATNQDIELLVAETRGLDQHLAEMQSALAGKDREIASLERYVESLGVLATAAAEEEVKARGAAEIAAGSAEALAGHAKMEGAAAADAADAAAAAAEVVAQEEEVEAKTEEASAAEAKWYEMQEKLPAAREERASLKAVQDNYAEQRAAIEERLHIIKDAAAQSPLLRDLAADKAYVVLGARTWLLQLVLTPLEGLARLAPHDKVVKDLLGSLHQVPGACAALCAAQLFEPQRFQDTAMLLEGSKLGGLSSYLDSLPRSLQGGITEDKPSVSMDELHGSLLSCQPMRWGMLMRWQIRSVVSNRPLVMLESLSPPAAPAVPPEAVKLAAAPEAATSTAPEAVAPPPAATSSDPQPLLPHLQEVQQTVSSKKNRKAKARKTRAPSEQHPHCSSVVAEVAAAERLATCPTAANLHALIELAAPFKAQLWEHLAAARRKTSAQCSETPMLSSNLLPLMRPRFEMCKQMSEASALIQDHGGRQAIMEGPGFACENKLTPIACANSHCTRIWFQVHLDDKAQMPPSACTFLSQRPVLNRAANQHPPDVPLYQVSMHSRTEPGCSWLKCPVGPEGHVLYFCSKDCCGSVLRALQEEITHLQEVWPLPRKSSKGEGAFKYKALPQKKGKKKQQVLSMAERLTYGE